MIVLWEWGIFSSYLPSLCLPFGVRALCILFRVFEMEKLNYSSEKRDAQQRNAFNSWNLWALSNDTIIISTWTTKSTDSYIINRSLEDSLTVFLTFICTRLTFNHFAILAKFQWHTFQVSLFNTFCLMNSDSFGPFLNEIWDLRWEVCYCNHFIIVDTFRCCCRSND